MTTMKKLNVRTPIVFSICLILLMYAASCKKNNNPTHSESTYPVITDSTYNPVDPSPSATIGFFGNSWTGRTYSAPADTVVAGGSSIAATDSLTIDVNNVLVKTPPLVYGNNINPYMGQVVTQPTLMQYLKDLSPNVLRGPGGSLSDVYFWNGTAANPAPADAPDTIYQTGGTLGPLSPWYGGNTQAWTLSLANYYNVLAQTNSTAYLTVNYGYARYGTGTSPVDSAAHLAANWVRYDAGKTKYWEIGNETYGGWEAGYQIDTTQNHDGQPEFVTGALYAQQLNVFADSMRAAAQETGATIYIGAFLAVATSESISNWNQGVLSNIGNGADFFIIHDYFTPYEQNSTAATILATGTAVPTADMSYVKQQLQTYGLSAKPIAMSEWNIQATGSKQNTSYISGMHAALTLGSFIKNQFGEASRWDLANGYLNGDDQGMFNIGDEPNAPLWNPRPAFYYMYYFQKFFGDRMVYDTLRRPLFNTDLVTYSSTFTSGQAGTVIINPSIYNHVVAIDLQHFSAGAKYHWYILTGGTDNSPFSSQVYVNGTGPATPTGGPLNYSTIKPYAAALNGTIKMFVPPYSVIYLVADSK
jgi:hypothetical protein